MSTTMATGQDSGVFEEGKTERPETDLRVMPFDKQYYAVIENTVIS